MNGYADVATLRTNELLCASRELGLAGVHFLGYRDSGMVGADDNQHAESLHAAPLDEVAQRIIGYINELKPDTIVTHDQFGGYGHPDHIKLHQATMRAYELLYGIHWQAEANGLWSATKTNPSAPRLYFSIIPKGLVKFGVRLLPLFRQDTRKFGRNKDIDLVTIASWDVAATTKVDTKRYVEAKDKASACHVSQQAPVQQTNTLQGRVVRFMFRRNQGVEYFSRAYPPYVKGERQETGLFGD
jgi:LmbE family N-acetylglucosaminyl deacetylase